MLADTNVLYLILLVVVGLVVGVINTLAGGGSLLTLPILISFVGLPSDVANGTNRLGILLQSITGIAGFQSKGVKTMRYGLWLGGISMLGAVIGANLAIQINDETFNIILAVIMFFVMGTLVYNPFKGKEVESHEITPKRLAASLMVFFFIGIYIGFIQAGAGFFIIASLMLVAKQDLLRTNSIKLWVNLLATIMALGVFIYQDAVHWPYGVALSIGNGVGAWGSSLWAASGGVKWIRPLLIVMIFLLALKLLGVFDWLMG